jgi:hypothetical protein
MDLLICSVTSIAFVVFMIVHVLVFRHIKHSQIMLWFMIIYFIIGLIVPGLGALWLVCTGSQFIVCFFIFLLSFILYSFSVFIYLLAVFGILESSVRIRVLIEIMKNGNRGISEAALFKRYNMQTIIERRLVRFVDSSELLFEKGRYCRPRKLSLFFLSAVIMDFFWKLYGESLV